VTDDRAAERRKSICPNCSQRADPCSVTEGKDLRVIEYWCAVCQYMWHVNTMPERLAPLGSPLEIVQRLPHKQAHFLSLIAQTPLGIPRTLTR